MFCKLSACSMIAEDQFFETAKITREKHAKNTEDHRGLVLTSASELPLLKC